MGAMVGSIVGNIYGAPLMHKKLNEINENEVESAMTMKNGLYNSTTNYVTKSF